MDCEACEAKCSHPLSPLFLLPPTPPCPFLADPLQHASEQTLVLILAALAEGNI